MIVRDATTKESRSPAVVGTMLFDLPLPLAANPEVRAVDQQMQGLDPAANRDVDGQSGLPPADGAETKNRPLQPEQLGRISATTSEWGRLAG